MASLCVHQNIATSGYVLDQGSNPTHKGIIISLYEQGISPSDIALKTGHNQESVDRYLKTYDQVLQLQEAITAQRASVRYSVEVYIRFVNT